MRILIVALLFLCGCEEEKIIEKKNAISVEKAPERFEVTSYGSFQAGYDNNKREILILKDKNSGKEYLAITGCGVSELHQESNGKTVVVRED
jgi:hypothetical protein